MNFLRKLKAILNGAIVGALTTWVMEKAAQDVERVFKEALTVACPVCGSPIGEVCTEPEMGSPDARKRRTPHISRVDLSAPNGWRGDPTPHCEGDCVFCRARRAAPGSRP